MQSIIACSGLHKTYAGLEVAVLNGMMLEDAVQRGMLIKVIE